MEDGAKALERITATVSDDTKRRWLQMVAAIRQRNGGLSEAKVAEQLVLAALVTWEAAGGDAAAAERVYPFDVSGPQRHAVHEEADAYGPDLHAVLTKAAEIVAASKGRRPPRKGA